MFNFTITKLVVYNLSQVFVITQTFRTHADSKHTFHSSSSQQEHGADAGGLSVAQLLDLPEVQLRAAHSHRVSWSPVHMQ